MTPEEKAERRRVDREAFAKSIFESYGISLEEHTRRLIERNKQRKLVLKEEGLDEEDDE